MKVIGAGFGRTGTASLKAALEHLGFGPCYHMFDVFGDRRRVAHWEHITTGGTPDWARVFDGYAATVDWPGTRYWRELIEAYPDATVVLTVRDPQRWYASMHDTIYQFAVAASRRPPDAQVPELVARMGPVVNRLIWEGTFAGRFADRDHALGVFEAHNAEVCRVVPADRLVVMDMAQGWKPLCEHLDVDVPAEDFPHVNAGEQIKTALQTLQVEGRLPSPFEPAEPSQAAAGRGETGAAH